MRYMKHVTTGDVVAIGDDDDARFEELKSERLPNGRAAWQQTGAHDPAVLEIEVAGQDPPNGAEPETPGASTTGQQPLLEQLASDQNEILREQLQVQKEALAAAHTELDKLRESAKSRSGDAQRITALEQQVSDLTTERDEARAAAERLVTERDRLEQQLAEAAAPKPTDGDRPARGRTGGR